VAEQKSRRRAVLKFLFWTAAAGGVLAVAIQSFVSGQMAAWFYYEAANDGYAVNADSFRDATAKTPAALDIVATQEIVGRQAVLVKRGDRLPRNANGVIETKIVEQGRRVELIGSQLVVKIPWEIKESKGFKYKDTFKHKGLHTFGWIGVWNVLIVLALGVTLGFMAEGFTDMLGLKLSRIQHHVGH